MDAFTAITTALGGLKTATDLATGMRKSLAAHELKLEEVPGKVMELQGFIMDSRTALGDAEDELREKNRQIYQLEVEIIGLKDQLAKKAQGSLHDGAAWKALGDGKEAGPYCPNCWEKTGKFIQPHPGANDGAEAVFFCSDHGAKNFAFRVPSSLCSGIATKTPRPSPAIRTDFPSRRW